MVSYLQTKINQHWNADGIISSCFRLARIYDKSNECLKKFKAPAFSPKHLAYPSPDPRQKSRLDIVNKKPCNNRRDRNRHTVDLIIFNPGSCCTTECPAFCDVMHKYLLIFFLMWWLNVLDPLLPERIYRRHFEKHLASPSLTNNSLLYENRKTK